MDKFLYSNIIYDKFTLIDMITSISILIKKNKCYTSNYINKDKLLINKSEHHKNFLNFISNY